MTAHAYADVSAADDYAIAYGTTEKLSKFWMPLDEFTNATMEGLKTGAAYIPVGRAAQVYERFEEGKDKLIMELRRRS